jgi:hypothetical protein
MLSDEVAHVQLEDFLLEIDLHESQSQISVPHVEALAVDQHSQVYPIGRLVSKF